MPFRPGRSLLTMLVLASAACGRRARPDEVPGTYVMNRGRAADTLVVRPGGTYLRRYVAPGGAPATDSGAWSVDTATGEGRIVFEGFVARWRGEVFPGLPDPGGGRGGLWAVAAERPPGGGVRLPVNDDVGWAYVRVAAP